MKHTISANKKPATVISLANQKGGVLKTTSTHNIGTALASMDKKVLSIDFDPQCSLTISVGKEPYDFETNICSLLQKNPQDIKECIYNISNNYDIIPGSLFLASLELELTSRTARETILARTIKAAKNDYDYILIDCPPQLSILTINALAAADLVLVPCKTEYLPYRGLEQLEDTIKDVKELVNPDLEFFGVIATLYEKSIKDHNEILNHLKDNYKVVGIIKKTAEASKGIYDGTSVVQRKPGLEISQQFILIADALEEYRSNL